MLPFTLKYQSARSEYFAFPYPILKDKYVSHTSLCNGSWNHYIHTNNRPNTPISKYSSTDMSILNIVHWITKTYILITKYCTCMLYQELILSAQFPKVVLCIHVSSTVIQLTTHHIKLIINATLHVISIINATLHWLLISHSAFNIHNQCMDYR